MKAIQFDRLGGPEVLRAVEISAPEPRPGTIVVRNRIIALNFGDTFFIRGTYLVTPVLPDTPAMEGAGVIEAVTVEVADLNPGTRVAYIGMGAFAECTRLRASCAIVLPEDLSFEQAAALPIAALTAWHMLHTCHHTAPGQVVIVHSPAGGVGLAAVQIAKAAGVRVIGTVSLDEKLEVAGRFGADEVINYQTDDFAAQALRLTNNRGVDLILDAVGKPTLHKGLACLAPFGHLISFGQVGGAPDRVDPVSLFGKAIKLSGFAVPLVYAMGQIHRRGVDEVFRLSREGRLAIPVGARFPLSRPPRRCAF